MQNFSRLFQTRLRKLGKKWVRKGDLHQTTYSNQLQQGVLKSYLNPLPRSLLEPHQKLIFALANNFILHRFNLLGSGWIQVKHGMKCAGLEGYRYDAGQPVNADKEGQWLMGRINEMNTKESQRKMKNF